jgi:hypothetical protein
MRIYRHAWPARPKHPPLMRSAWRRAAAFGSALSCSCLVACANLAGLQGGDGDGGATTDAGGACTLGDTDASSIAWSRIKSAQERPGYLELTADSLGQAGAVFAPNAASLDAFDVTFEASITHAADAGAGQVGWGLAFVALSQSTPPSGCQYKGAICVLNQASGFAVAIVTATNGFGDGFPGPFLGLTNAMAPSASGNPFTSPLLETVLPSIDDTMPPPEASWHQVEVRVSGGAAQIYFDGADVVSGPVPTSDASPPPQYWGFAASTDDFGGVASERSAVRNVVMKLQGAGCGM